MSDIDEMRLHDLARALVLAFEPPWPAWEQIVEALRIQDHSNWAMALGDAARRANHPLSSNPNPGPRSKVPPKPRRTDSFNLDFWRWNYDAHAAWEDGWYIADGLIARKVLDEKPCDFGCVGTIVRAECERHNPPQVVSFSLRMKERVDRLEATLRDTRADIRSRFVSPQWDIKHVGTVSHCGICGANGEEDVEPNHTASCTLSIGVP